MHIRSRIYFILFFLLKTSYTHVLCMIQCMYVCNFIMYYFKKMTFLIHVSSFDVHEQLTSTTSSFFFSMFIFPCPLSSSSNYFSHQTCRNRTSGMHLFPCRKIHRSVLCCTVATVCYNTNLSVL